MKFRLARLVRNIIVEISDALIPTSCDEYRRAAMAQYRAPRPAVTKVETTSA